MRRLGLPLPLRARCSRGNVLYLLMKPGDESADIETFWRDPPELLGLAEDAAERFGVLARRASPPQAFQAFGVGLANIEISRPFPFFLLRSRMTGEPP